MRVTDALSVTRCPVNHSCQRGPQYSNSREELEEGVRREALRRIPGSAGRNLGEHVLHSGVNGLPGRESARGQ